MPAVRYKLQQCRGDHLRATRPSVNVWTQRRVNGVVTKRNATHCSVHLLRQRWEKQFATTVVREWLVVIVITACVRCDMSALKCAGEIVCSFSCQWSGNANGQSVEQYWDRLLLCLSVASAKRYFTHRCSQAVDNFQISDFKHFKGPIAYAFIGLKQL